MDTQDTLELYTIILQTQYWNRICHASSTIIVLYDFCITFSDECDFIWKSRWSLGKTLFLTSRYYTLISAILEIWVLYSPHVSTRVSYWTTVLQAFGALFQVIMTDLILQVRLHAMYDGNKMVLYAIGMPFALVSITAATQLVLYAIGLQISADNVPGDTARFCVQTRGEFGGTWIFWAQFLALEVLFFGFALYKAYQTYRKMDDIMGSIVPKTLSVLIRDSTLYFFMIALSYLANTIVSPIDNGRYQHLPEGFASSISSIMGQRLILNLRSCYYGKTDHGDFEEFTLSTWMVNQRPTSTRPTSTPQDLLDRGSGFSVISTTSVDSGTPSNV